MDVQKYKITSIRISFIRPLDKKYEECVVIFSDKTSISCKNRILQPLYVYA